MVEYFTDKYTHETVAAIQWNGDNIGEIIEFVGSDRCLIGDAWGKIIGNVNEKTKFEPHQFFYIKNSDGNKLIGHLNFIYRLKNNDIDTFGYCLTDEMEYNPFVKTFLPQNFINYATIQIKDWFKTNGDNCKAIIGISGGKDSTVAAALCARALGPDRVIGVAIPDINQGTNNAEDICKELGIRCIVCPISQVTSSLNNVVSASLLGINTTKISEQTTQNIPPRIRMATLYAISQSLNGRVVGTSNKSELAIGYFTRYGDGACDFEPLSSLTCRQVVEVGKALGISDKWIYRIPDDGLPNSCSDDQKFAKWGFSYEKLDNYLEFGTSGDAAVDSIIYKRISNNRFKLKLGTFLDYKQQ